MGPREAKSVEDRKTWNTRQPARAAALGRRTSKRLH
jgi:hypothetical protein